MAIVEHKTDKKAAYLKLVENNRVVLIMLFFNASSFCFHAHRNLTVILRNMTSG